MRPDRSQELPDARAQPNPTAHRLVVGRPRPRGGIPQVRRAGGVQLLARDEGAVEILWQESPVQILNAGSDSE
jgi:hypothetical protein